MLDSTSRLSARCIQESTLGWNFSRVEAGCIPQSMLIDAIKACLLLSYRACFFRIQLRYLGLTKGGLNDSGLRLVPPALSSETNDG
jgi:hypothetical protein